MKYFICVGHANYGGGVISSADGTSKGGVNEYKYNKELAPYVCKWLKAAGHEATLCIAPEGQLHSLNDEIKYFIDGTLIYTTPNFTQINLEGMNFLHDNYGGDAYIDNIKINEASMAVSSVKKGNIAVYPNPVKTNLHFNLPKFILF